MGEPYDDDLLLAAIDAQSLVLVCESQALDAYIRLSNDGWARGRYAVVLGTLDRITIRRTRIVKDKKGK